MLFLSPRNGRPATGGHDREKGYKKRDNRWAISFLSHFVRLQGVEPWTP